MSFSEDQIRAIVKNELRRIIDAGLMYTIADNAPSPQPQQHPQQQALKPATGMFKDETVKYTLVQFDGSIKPIHYIADSALFGRINDDLKAHGYNWLKAGKESRWIKS
jgi:hypothetical protein